MKIRFFLSVFIFSFALASVLFAAEMRAVNFTQKGEVSELEFIFDSNEVLANKFQVKEDKQIIIDLSNVSATDRVMRAFDTSQFTGGVIFVRAYKKSKNEKDIRVAIQLRDNVRSLLVRKPNKVVLQIENRFGVFSQKKVEDNQSFKEKVAEVSSETVGKLNIPKSESIEDILENLTQSGRKKYIGKKITMNLKSAKPDEILKMIAETSGFNIIITDDVKKLDPISLSLSDIPWDQALDTVLDMNKLVARKNGMILLINTYDTATKDREAELKAKASMIVQEPLVTKIFPISFAEITDLKTILTDYLSEKSAGGEKRGKISIDKRTNSLIVKDTMEVIERIKKIVELLDAQTPQVLIESKIVEVSERYSKEIGLSQGLSVGYDVVGSPSGNSGPGFAFSSAPSAERSLFGLSVKRFNRLANLDFNLKLMESESKGKIISSPKVIAKNNFPAKITQNEIMYYKEVTYPPLGNPTVVWKPQDAKLELVVTPQITNEGSISLDVEVKKDSLNAPIDAAAPLDKIERQVKTQVLVDNGATVVIGGIYSFAQKEHHSGIPYLKDIPLLGWLFRTPYNPETTKNELIIFLTPRIINQEEAGMVDKG